MLLDLHQQAGRLELRDDGLARGIPLEAAETLRRILVDVRIRRHHVDLLEIVPLADFEVSLVVRRRDLHGTGAERGVDGVIAHNRNHPVDQRQPDVLADQQGVARIVGVYRHSGVAEHCLGARRGDHQRAAAIGERIAEVPDPAVGLFFLGFFVRERGQASRTPVDDVLAAIDQPLLVQAHEDFAHCPREIFVECEVGPRPVAARAERLQLVEDLTTRLMHEGPDSLHELFAAHIEARETFLREDLLHHVLRRNAGVVGARHPERATTTHPLEA